MLGEYRDLISEALDYLESTPPAASTTSKGTFAQFGRWCAWVKRVQGEEERDRTPVTLSLVRPSVLVNDVREFPSAWEASTHRLGHTISELHTADTYMNNFFAATSEPTPRIWDDAANVWRIDPAKMWVSPYMTDDAKAMRGYAVNPTPLEDTLKDKQGPYGLNSEFAPKFDVLTVYKTSRSADIDPDMRHFLGPLIPIGFTARSINPMNHTPPARINSSPVIGTRVINADMAGLEDHRIAIARMIWRELVPESINAHLMSRGVSYGAIAGLVKQEFLKRAVERVAAITMETYLHDLFAMKLGVTRQPYLLRT